MKYFLLAIIALLAGPGLSAQPVDSTWKVGGVVNVTFTNTGFGNTAYWQGGAISSISLVGIVNLFANIEHETVRWQNTLDLAYGTIQQGDRPFIKADDRIELNSKVGYELNEKLLMSAQANFRTQFDAGFNFKDGPLLPDGTVPRNLISQTLSPAYLNIGLGLDYQPDDQLSVFYAPLNAKMTIVTLKTLRPLYVPDDKLDNAVRFELGSFLNFRYRKELATNVVYQTKADFFLNYIENFGNVDVNWENLIALQVNKYLNATFFTHLIYDDDINFDIVDENGNPTGQSGPRTQFKHVLGIGFTYSFGSQLKDPKR